MENLENHSTQATAVLVFHGMGQQVPFETLGNVAEKLRRRHELDAPGVACEVAAENVSCLGGAPADAIISRIRMRIRKGNAPARIIDFYESYWAPITAGKINSLDALKFLVNAGIAGILRSLRPIFARFFWQGSHDFRLPRRRNVLALSAVLLLVLSLAFLTVRTLGAIHDKDWSARVEELSLLFRAIHLLVFPTLLVYLAHTFRKTTWPVKGGLFMGFLLGFVQLPWLIMPRLMPQNRLTQAIVIKQAGAVHAVWGLLGATAFSLLLAIALIRRKPRESRPSYNGQLIWQQSWLIGGAIVTAAVYAILFMLDIERYDAGQLASPWMRGLYGLIGLGVLFVLRSFLLEYIGDLAAYLSAHEASKFSEMRSRIQAEAFKTACHVYDSPYDEVVVVGHSLGSVLAYDTLNGIITHDAVKNQAPDRKPWRSVERTKLLLTFGSPLDKTAFLFRAQVEKNPTREVLAAAKQPLLEESHRYRPGLWANVWSPCDVISARLEYYDRGRLVPGTRLGGQKSYAFTYEAYPAISGSDPICSPLAFRQEPGPKVAPVVSLIDPKADIPFAAHTQFWDNSLIYDILAKAVLDEDPGALGRFISVSAAKGGTGRPAPTGPGEGR